MNLFNCSMEFHLIRKGNLFRISQSVNLIARTLSLDLAGGRQGDIYSFLRLVDKWTRLVISKLMSSTYFCTNIVFCFLNRRSFRFIKISESKGFWSEGAETRSKKTYIYIQLSTFRYTYNYMFFFFS